MIELNAVTRFRWKILLMLFLATTINYVDRSVIGVLGPTLRNHVFHWSNIQYGDITNSFMFAYVIGQLFMGRTIDRLGTRIGYALSIGIWSFFSLMSSFVTVSMGWIGFAVARFGLGFGESGNFPACIKTVAEWFPKKERAFATGMFNAGSNIGAVLAPLLIPLVVSNDGRHWQLAFCMTFGFSLTWLIFWLRTYRKPEVHPKVSPGELAYILSDSEPQSKTKLSWSRILGIRETWAIVAAKIPDAVWWFYLFWGGFFLNSRFGLELKGLAIPIIIIYAMADLGSIFGGWLSSYMIRTGLSINWSRKLTMLICALIILPVTYAPQTSHEWTAVFLIGLAAGGHQAWSANAYTLASDIFPKKAIASVIGIGGSAGAIASICANYGLSHMLDNGGQSAYTMAFLIAGCIYFVALVMIHLITPKLKPVEEKLSFSQ